MVEVRVEVKKQKDGWYLATTGNTLEKGSFVTEAPDYTTLKRKIKEAIKLLLRDGYHKELGLPKDPQIRLVYSELLFKNPEAERILIIGNRESGGYRARTNTLLNLDLYHKNLDGLREQLLKEIQQHGHSDKHVEFKLEEVL
ncbi:hypothetical protein DRJ16_02785 [Candidatus Woesearchaeota archaeon]|nr:MAG: hypothetical protein DRJ16_02785 [Candidatus Woesearchaeota archaeon]